MRAAENHPLTDPGSPSPGSTMTRPSPRPGSTGPWPAWAVRPRCAKPCCAGSGQRRPFPGPAPVARGAGLLGPELATACEQALGLRLAVNRQAGGDALCAHPVKVGDDLIGVVGVRFRQAGAPAGTADRLRWGSGWLALRLVKPARRTQRGPRAADDRPRSADAHRRRPVRRRLPGRRHRSRGASGLRPGGHRLCPGQGHRAGWRRSPTPPTSPAASTWCARWKPR